MAANRFNFRVWLEEHQTMTRTYHVEDVPTADCDTNYILMQSTGLGDANGVEIFEGDVVRWGSEDLGGVRLFEIVFADGAFMGQTASGFFHEHPQHLGFAKSAEVIGNIHQNGDLLS